MAFPDSPSRAGACLRACCVGTSKPWSHGAPFPGSVKQGFGTGAVWGLWLQPGELRRRHLAVRTGAGLLAEGLIFFTKNRQKSRTWLPLEAPQLFLSCWADEPPNASPLSHCRGWHQDLISVPCATQRMVFVLHRVSCVNTLRKQPLPNPAQPSRHNHSR